MTAIATVAGGVFKESIRDRVAYNLLFFAVLLMAASFLLAQLTAGQDVKIIKDLGLASASAIGVFIAIFIGITLVSREVERRSVYSLLAKPVTRNQFILGKYLGLVLTLMANLAVMALAFYIVLAYLDSITPANVKAAWEAPATDPRMLKAFVLIGVELMLVTAVALFFSTFSSPILSSALTFAIYVIGHFSVDLRDLGAILESPAAGEVARGLYYAIPNLAALNVRSEVVHAQPVTLEHMTWATGASGLYIAALLVASMAIFSRRDFK
jgi:ABC-type transport system involved in multi-copper enzyme maturation permease subunit